MFVLYKRNKRAVSVIYAEWTLYEQVAIAAMDCQSLGVAQVNFPYAFNWYLENYMILF